MPSGSKPGERRGGRNKGTPNKRTQARLRTEEAVKAKIEAGDAPPAPPAFDPIAQMEQWAMLFTNMAVEERRKEKPDVKWIRELGESCVRTCNCLAPYKARKLATLEPAMETVVKADGSVHVTVSRSDAGL